MTWFQTLTGRKVDLLAPRPEDIDLAGDVAPALSRIVRFNGHTRFPYSVAQHSVLGARALAPLGARTALMFLLHDAHEAYLGDIVGPVLGAFVDYERMKRAKRAFDAAIWQAATGEPWAPRAEIREFVADMDLRMLRTERDQLKTPPPAPWTDLVEHAEPLPILIEEWSAEQAASEWTRMLKGR